MIAKKVAQNEHLMILKFWNENNYWKKKKEHISKDLFYSNNN